MSRRALALAVAVCLATPVLPGTGYAQPAAPSAPGRAEARERFDRGLRLFNAGDNAGALVEFRRAYELVENVVVLFNIGLVCAQMGRAAEAVDALDRVLAGPGALSAERVSLARKVRDEQEARVAEVAVESNVPGARVEVDGIEAGKTPLSTPLRVTSGTHVIGVVAPGFSPERKEIEIAGGQKQSAKFELVAMQGRLAHLLVKTHVPGADVYDGGQHIGTTPLAASVSLSPGDHHVEMRRAGYITAGADVTLGDGATGEVALEPAEDPEAPSPRGALALDVSETLAVVTVDGHALGAYTTPVRLVAGPHHALVERADFVAFERDVTIEPGRTTTVRVALEPTSEYRTRYVSRSLSQRTWAFVSIIGGAAVLAGGFGLVAYDAGQRSDGISTQNRIRDLSNRGSMQLCDPGGDTTAPAYVMNCAQPYSAAAAKVSDADTRDYLGWAAVGIGAAGAVLGVVLFVTADDPHKYDPPKPAAERAAAWSGVPTVWAVPGGGGVGFVGMF